MSYKIKKEASEKGKSMNDLNAVSDILGSLEWSNLEDNLAQFKGTTLAFLANFTNQRACVYREKTDDNIKVYAVFIDSSDINGWEAPFWHCINNNSDFQSCIHLYIYIFDISLDESFNVPRISSPPLRFVDIINTTSKRASICILKANLAEHIHQLKLYAMEIKVNDKPILLEVPSFSRSTAIKALQYFYGVEAKDCYLIDIRTLR